MPAPKAPSLTQAYVRSLLHYNEETGEFTWKRHRSPKTRMGDLAGCENNGEWKVMIDGRPYQAHRLAWLWVHGEWPLKQVRHRNGNRTDNRLENLIVTRIGRDKNADVEHERLLALLHYDPLTGEFRWKERRGVVFDKNAGSDRGDGYFSICVDGKRYLVHRLAWFYVHGLWPIHQIDHINGNPSDNRLANLREATNSQNQQNTGPRSSNSKSGHKCVYLHKSGKWYARITVNNRTFTEGYFADKADAVEARNRLLQLHAGEFAKVN
jgi:hypothetical protein